MQKEDLSADAVGIYSVSVRPGLDLFPGGGFACIQMAE